MHLHRFRVHHQCWQFLESGFVAPHNSTFHAGYRRVVGRSSLQVDHVKIFSVFQQLTYQYDIETMNISFFAISLPDKGDGSNIVGVVQPCNRSQGQGSVSDSMKPRQGVAVGRHSLSPRRWHRPHNCGLGIGWPPWRSRRHHSSTLVRKSQTSGFRQGCNRSRSHRLR